MEFIILAIAFILGYAVASFRHSHHPDHFQEYLDDMDKNGSKKHDFNPHKNGSNPHEK